MAQIPRELPSPSPSLSIAYPESSIPEMAGVPPLPVANQNVLASRVSGVNRPMLLDPQFGAMNEPGVANPYSYGAQPEPLSPSPIPPFSSPPFSPPPSSYPPATPSFRGNAYYQFMQQLRDGSVSRSAGYQVPEPSPSDSPPVLAPRGRDARLQVFRDLLAKFTYSLAYAYSAPPGRRLGAALMGPYAYEERQHKLELERAQELQRTAAVQQAMSNITRQQTRLPYEVQQLIDSALRARGQAAESEANVPVINARAGQVQALTGEAQARTGEAQARTGLIGAQTERARTYVTPNGIFRINPQTQQMEQVPGADTTTRITMTPELLKSLKLPEELDGARLRPQDINALRVGAHDKIYNDANGVQLYDQNTGEIRKLGDLPPARSPGQYTPLLDNFGQILSFFNPANGHSVDVPIAGARRTGVAQATMTRADVLNQLADSAGALRQLANDHQAVIGRVVGSAAGILRNWIDLDPEINALFRLSDNMADILLRARSGAQINEQEFQRLRKLAPDPRTAKSKFFTDLEEFAKEIETSRKYVPPSLKGQEKVGSEDNRPIPSNKESVADQIRRAFPGSKGKK